MSHRILLLLLVLAPLFADEASKAAKAAELMDLMTDNGKVFTEAMNDALPQPPPSLSSDQQELMRRFTQRAMETFQTVMPWEKLRAEAMQIYLDAFTESQIDDMLAFYRSPAGRAMVAKQPDMNRKMTALITRVIADVQPELQRIMQELIEERQRSQGSPPPPKPAPAK